MNDKTITIYNHRKNPDKTETWQRTVISGVNYGYGHEKTVDATGKIIVSESLNLLIPIDADASGREYIDFKEFPAAESDKYWTLNPTGNKDVIVCGDCEREITEDYSILELQRDFTKCGTLAGFSDNTDAPLLKHWKVMCK